VGGIKAITLIDPADAIMIPSAHCNGVYNGDILYTTAYTIECDRNSANFNEKSNPSNPNGDYLEGVLTFAVTKERAAVATLVQGCLNRRLHIRFVYNDGTTKVLLNARAITDHNSGTQRREGNGTKWTFTAQTRKRAPILTPSIDLSGAFDGSGFTDGFLIDYAGSLTTFSNGFSSTSFS
jgi:hypothetical protein